MQAEVVSVRELHQQANSAESRWEICARAVNVKVFATRRLTGMDAEIAALALPALASLAADPLAGLVDTAYIGRLGRLMPHILEASQLH